MGARRGPGRTCTAARRLRPVVGIAGLELEEFGGVEVDCAASVRVDALILATTYSWHSVADCGAARRSIPVVVFGRHGVDCPGGGYVAGMD
jgi:hypothetical protein